MLPTDGIQVRSCAQGYDARASPGSEAGTGTGAGRRLKRAGHTRQATAARVTARSEMWCSFHSSIAAVATLSCNDDWAASSGCFTVQAKLDTDWLNVDVTSVRLHGPQGLLDLAEFRQSPLFRRNCSGGSRRGGLILV